MGDARRQFRPVALAAVSVIVSLALAATASAAPNPPTGLHLQAAAPGAVSLAWDHVPTAQFYEYFRDGVRINSTTRNSPAVVDTNALAVGSTYQYQVRVTDASGTSALSAPITVTIPTSSTGLSTCAQPFPLPKGNYYLRNDVNMTSGASACYDLSGNSTLDCKGHKITVTASSQTASVIRVKSGGNVLIANCAIDTKGDGDAANAIHVGPAGPGAASAPVADNVTVYNNTINGLTNTAYGIDAFWTNHLVMANNTLNQAQVGGFYLPGAVINANRMTIAASWTGIAGVLWMHQSDNQLIGDNYIEGGADGFHGRTDEAGNLTGGTDDSIIIDGPVKNVWIRDNTVGYNYDAGIETVDAFRNGHIENNTISSVYEAGIGAYHRTVFDGNSVRGNKIIHSGRAILIVTGGQLPNDKPIDQDYLSIRDNYFSSNTFTQSTRWTLPAACWDGVNHDTGTNAVPTQVSGNSAVINAFDTSAKAPYYSPGMFLYYASNQQGSTPAIDCSH